MKGCLGRVSVGSRAMRILTGHEGSVDHLVYLLGGQVLASGGADGTIRFWDAYDGSERSRLFGPPSEDPDKMIDAMAASPDGTRLAVLCRERTGSPTGPEPRVMAVRVLSYDPSSDSWLDVHDQPVLWDARDIAFCHDGETILVASPRPAGTFLWFRIGSPRASNTGQLGRLDLHLESVGLERVLVGPGDRLVLGRIRGIRNPGAIRPFQMRWQVRELSQLVPMPALDLPTRKRDEGRQGRRAIPQSTRFLDTGRAVFFADGWSAEGIVDLRAWQVDLNGVAPEGPAPEWDLMARLDGLASRVSALDLSPDHRLLAMATRDGRIRIAPITTGSIRPGYLTDLGVIRDVRFAPDALTLATSGEGGLAVWDVDLF